MAAVSDHSADSEELKKIEPEKVDNLELEGPECVAASSAKSGEKIEEKKLEPPAAEEVKDVKTDEEPKSEEAEEIKTDEKPKAEDAAEPPVQKVDDKQVEFPTIKEETKTEDRPITEGAKETVFEPKTTNNSEPSTECKSEDGIATGSVAETEESKSESVEEKIGELSNKVEELPAAVVETIVPNDVKVSKISEYIPLVEEKPLEQPEVTELTVKEPTVVDPVKDVEVETGIDKVEGSELTIEVAAAKEETIVVGISDQVESDTPEIKVLVKDVEHSPSGEVLEKTVETKAEKIIEPTKNEAETAEKSVVSDKSSAECEGDTERTPESQVISRDIQLAPKIEKKEETVASGETNIAAEVCDKSEKEATITEAEDRIATGGVAETEESKSESVEEKIEELPNKVEELPAAEVETIVPKDVKVSKIPESIPLVDKKPLEQPEVTELTVKEPIVVDPVKDVEVETGIGRVEGSELPIEVEAAKEETIVVGISDQVESDTPEIKVIVKNVEYSPSGEVLEKTVETKAEKIIEPTKNEAETAEKSVIVDKSSTECEGDTERTPESQVISRDIQLAPKNEKKEETVASGETNIAAEVCDKAGKEATITEAEDRIATGSVTETEELKSESVEEKIEELPNKVDELPAAEVETIVPNDVKVPKISESIPLVEENPLEQPEVTELTVKEPIVVDPVKDVEVETGIDKVEGSELPIEVETAKEETTVVGISDQVESDTPELKIQVKDEYSPSGEVLEKTFETKAEKIIEPTKNEAENAEKSVVPDKSTAECEGDTERTAESEVISRDIQLAPKDEKKEETLASGETNIAAEVCDKAEKEATITKAVAKEAEKTPVTETKEEEEKKDDEAVKADAQDLECTKDSEETKPSQDVPKEDVPVKTQKQSNNIIKMVKHSLGKAKKAIIGKSQNSKAPAASETKDEVTK